MEFEVSEGLRKADEEAERMEIGDWELCEREKEEDKLEDDDAGEWRGWRRKNGQ